MKGKKQITILVFVLFFIIGLMVGILAGVFLGHRNDNAENHDVNQIINTEEVKTEVVVNEEEDRKSVV